MPATLISTIRETIGPDISRRNGSLRCALFLGEKHPSRWLHDHCAVHRQGTRSRVVRSVATQDAKQAENDLREPWMANEIKCERGPCRRTV